MITKVFAKDFKSFSFSQDLTGKDMFLGPNGSGKSVRSQALVLTLMGQINGTGKRPMDIMAAYAPGVSRMVVGCEYTDDKGVITEFERSFSLSSKGTASQRLRIDKRKASQAEFEVALSRIPTIFDRQDFLGKSDQKKIDAIFYLFPPAGDLKKLNGDIDNLTEKKNNLQENIRIANVLTGKEIKEKAELDLPAGTLAEVQGEIETTTKKVMGVRDQIEDEKIAQAKAKATKEEKERQEKKATLEREKRERKARETAKEIVAEGETREPPQQVIHSYSAHEDSLATAPSSKPLMSDTAKQIVQESAEATLSAHIARAKQTPTANPMDSPVIAAIEKMAATCEGCSSCFALTVSKRERKKHQQTNPKTA